MNSDIDVYTNHDKIIAITDQIQKYDRNVSRGQVLKAALWAATGKDPGIDSGITTWQEMADAWKSGITYNDTSNIGRDLIKNQAFEIRPVYESLGAVPVSTYAQDPRDTANLQSTTESGQSRFITVQQRAELLSSAGFPPELIPIMIAVSAGESGGDAGAHNPNRNTGDNSYGLWQINMIDTLGPSRRKSLGLSSNRQLFDPLTNAKAAKAIYDSQGLNAWTVYSKGTYKKYLPEVQRELKLRGAI